jgi:hypothetical protein
MVIHPQHPTFSGQAHLALESKSTFRLIPIGIKLTRQAHHALDNSLAAGADPFNASLRGHVQEFKALVAPRQGVV